MYRRLYLLTMLMVGLGMPAPNAQEAGSAPPPEKTMRAVRINPAPPKIDGVLNDGAWQHAPVFTGFTQRDPDEGKPASESTTVQIVYDDEAVYIGIRCYDREPDKIVSRLTRRDQWIEMDRVSVSLDPHHDHKTGFFFAVGPSGWKSDGILFNDTSDDEDWDGVWEGKASVDDRGWSVEYKIPYHVLRFSDKPVYTWGFNVMRQVSRKKEWDYWVMVPRGQNGWVSRFGHLEGIEGIHPRRSLEILPFGVSRSSFVPKSAAAPNGFDQFGTMGVDLRYGLSSNISLNGTFNPDFGQVEADPAVLNLGPFETFFSERRPFFLEGATIFNAPNPDIVGIGGPTRLFHSRRIGRAPGRFATPDTAVEIDRPEGTTILGATKLSGKTSRGLSFGLVEAVTANEFATIEDSVASPAGGGLQAVRSQFKVEPMTNYFVGRAQQDVFANSTVGATVTAMNGQGLAPAYVGSVDSQLKWKNNAYRVFTRLTGSRTGSGAGRKEGYEGILYFSKFSGTFGGQVYADARSPGFDANHLGFMNRADRIQTGGHFYVQIQHPWALARQSGFNVNVWSQWNYDRANLAKGVNFNTWQNLKNYWFVNFGVSREFEALDDRETRGGPLMVRPASTWFWSGLGTDSRKPVQVFINFSGSRAERGLSSSYSLGSWWTIRPASNVQLEFNPRYRIERNFAQWIKNLDGNGDGTPDRFLFGELDNRVLDLTTRATVSLTPDLSLQVYLQPFVAVGDYGAIKELVRPASYAFAPYDSLDNPDFSRRSLRSNVVLRWEYRPGSTLFLVWAQSRSASSDDPAFRPLRSLGSSFTDEGQNIFQVKVSYWFNM
jgi:hypothetical protein